MIIGSRQKLHAVSDSVIQTYIDSKLIKRVNHTKSLGLLIDDRLSWDRHVDEYLCKKVASAIGALKRARPFVTQAVAVQIYKALILPYFDYCSVVWDGLSSRLVDKVQKLQNRAARVILRASFDTSSCDLRNRLQWDSLCVRRKKQKAIMMYKSLNGLAPPYLQNLFASHRTNYDLRNCDKKKLSLPLPRTDYCKRSFSYSGAKTWNDLPPHVRLSTSQAQFQRELNKHFY